MVENDANDIATTRREHYEPGYDIQMVCHIEGEKNVDRSDLINMGVFKPTTKNAIKWLWM